MSRIQPEELSALLDGELSPERAAAVRQSLQADPVLRDEFARLADLDTRLRARAAAAAFEPRVAMPPRTASFTWIPGVLAGAGLALARLAPKYLNSTSIALALNCILLALLLSFVVWLVRNEQARSTS